MKRIKTAIGSSVLAVAPLLLAAALPAAANRIDRDLGTAIMPGANIVMFYDMQAAQNTAIGKAMEEMGEKFGDLMEQEQGSNMRELQRKFQEGTGLQEEDIRYMLLAVDLDNIDFAAAEPPAIDDLDLVVAIGLDKALSGQQLVEFIMAMAEEEGEEPKVRETSHRGVAVYTFTDIGDALELEAEELSMAMVADDRVCLVGPTAALRAAIERSTDGSRASLSPAMQGIEHSVQSGSQFYIMFTMTEAMKAEAAEAATKARAGDPSAAAQKAMGTLEGASLSLLMADDAKVALTGVFGTEEDAGAMTGYLNNMVISSIRMFGGMMLGPRPLPALQSLRSHQDGGRATLSFTITAQDLQTLREMAEAQPNMQMH